MSRNKDIWDIYTTIPGANIPDLDNCYGRGMPEMCNDEWFFAEAIVDMIDRKVKEQAQ